MVVLPYPHATRFAVYPLLLLVVCLSNRLNTPEPSSQIVYHSINSIMLPRPHSIVHSFIFPASPYPLSMNYSPLYIHSTCKDPLYLALGTDAVAHVRRCIL